MVLIMTVEPGYGGQKIRKDTFDKIRRLRTYIDENKLDVDIEVDGGVDLNNIYEVMDAGANVIVAGTKVIPRRCGEKCTGIPESNGVRRKNKIA